MNNYLSITMVSCQKGPTRHAYAWRIGSFWQDTLDKHFVVTQTYVNAVISSRPVSIRLFLKNNEKHMNNGIEFHTKTVLCKKLPEQFIFHGVWFAPISEPVTKLIKYGGIQNAFHLCRLYSVWVNASKSFDGVSSPLFLFHFMALYIYNSEW